MTGEIAVQSNKDSVLWVQWREGSKWVLLTHKPWKVPSGSSLQKLSRHMTGFSLGEPRRGLIPKPGSRVTVAVQTVLGKIPSDSSPYVEGFIVPLHDLSTAANQTDTTLNGLAEMGLPMREMPVLDQVLQKTRVKTRHQSCQANCAG